MDKQNPFEEFLSRLDVAVQRFLAEGVTDWRVPQEDEEIRAVIANLWSRIRKQRIRIVTELTRTRRGGPPEQVAFDTLDGLMDWVENHPHPLLDDLEDFRDWVSSRQYLTPTDPLRLRYSEYTGGGMCFMVGSSGSPADTPHVVSLTSEEMQAMVRILEEWHRVCAAHGLEADLDIAHRLAARHIQLHQERWLIGLAIDPLGFTESFSTDLVQYTLAVIMAQGAAATLDQFISFISDLVYWLMGNPQGDIIDAATELGAMISVESARRHYRGIRRVTRND